MARYGLYDAEGNVNCIGHPGNLYREDIDAQTFADWGVDYFKSDNCATYGARSIDLLAILLVDFKSRFSSTQTNTLVD